MVNESQLSLNLLHLTQRDLIFAYGNVNAETDVLLLIVSNDTDRSRTELFPQFSNEQMCLVTTKVVEDDRDVVGIVYERLHFR